MKIKIPNLIHRKKKKLRASTARRSLGVPDEMDYEEMSEPNMKLSRALLIVLVLHIVAVAGIIAFNSIKTREAAHPAARASQTASTPAPPAETVPAATENTPAAARSLVRNARDEAKPDPKKAAPKKASLDSGKTYTVVRGDNPVTIARKLKVAEADLLTLNHIDDPHKLQIGQKLMIPSRTVTKKKKSEN